MKYRLAVFSLALLSCALRAQEVRSVKTNANLSIQLRQQPPLQFSSHSSSTPKGILTIHVRPEERFQRIEGFGGSITDGTSWLLGAKVNPSTKDAIMTALFDPKKGIGLSFLRQPIGSTDLSRRPSTFDDIPAGKMDPELKHFSIQQDEEYTIPLIQQALKLNPAMTVMLSPWSAPAWMKTNGSLNGGRLREEAMAPFSKYLVKSVKAFESMGIPIKYLTVQNEPLYETPDYPGTLMPSSQAAELIGQYLGPDLKKAGVTTKVLAYDHNWDHPEYPLELLSNPRVAPYLAGSALHCYGGNVAAQEEIHKRFPEKGIWLTECSGGTWDQEPALVKTSRLLIESTRHWAKAVSLWGLVLDSDHHPHSGGCGTCRGLVTIDLHCATPSATYTGDYYALGHASKFVSPGAIRIASDSYGESSVETVALQNPDQSIILIALNNLNHAQPLRIEWSGKGLITSLEPFTLATYIWKPE